MSNISTIPAAALDDLNRRIDRALTHHDRAAATQAQHCATWLADLSPTVPVRQLAARAVAASRYLQGGRRHG